jgi:hypothetical protein
MKKITTLFLATIVTPCALFAATPAVYVPTASPSSNPDATVGGIPVDAWITNLPSGSGDFFASPSWALYSISAEASATHTFAGGALLTNQTVSVNFANGGMANGFAVGIRLLSAGTPVFSLYFLGGGPGTYSYSDAGGSGQNSGVDFSYFGTNTLSFTKTVTGYAASFGGASPSNGWSGTLSLSSVDSIQVFNDSHQNTGDNQVYWNSLSVSGVPEPSSFGVILGVGLLALILGRRMRGVRA